MVSIVRPHEGSKECMMLDLKDKEGKTNWWHVTAIAVFVLGIAMCVAGMVKVYGVAKGYQERYTCPCERERI